MDLKFKLAHIFTRLLNLIWSCEDMELACEDMNKDMAKIMLYYVNIR